MVSLALRNVSGRDMEECDETLTAAGLVLLFELQKLRGGFVQYSVGGTHRSDLNS